MSKQSYFKQFSLAYVQFSSIWLIDRTLSGATSPSLSGPESDGNEGVLCILGILTLDCLVSYLGHLLREGGAYLSAEKQLVYSTAPANWANFCLNSKDVIMIPFFF